MDDMTAYREIGTLILSGRPAPQHTQTSKLVRALTLTITRSRGIERGNITLLPPKAPRSTAERKKYTEL